MVLLVFDLVIGLFSNRNEMVCYLIILRMILSTCDQPDWGCWLF